MVPAPGLADDHAGDVDADGASLPQLPAADRTAAVAAPRDGAAAPHVLASVAAAVAGAGYRRRSGDALGAGCNAGVRRQRGGHALHTGRELLHEFRPVRVGDEE